MLEQYKVLKIAWKRKSEGFQCDREESSFCMQCDKVRAKLCRVEVELTWTQRIAGDLLHRHALAERPAVERRRVGAGPRSLLDTAPTRHVAGRPLGPQGPAAVHCGEFSRGEEVE